MAAPVRHLVLDSEAVAALLDGTATNRKRADVLTAVMAANGTRVVPTAVRVEAGWDRRDPAAANANRLAPADDALDRQGADRATALRHQAARGSAVDATVALAAARVPPTGIVEVLTSDVPDLTALTSHLDRLVDVHHL